MTKFIITLLSYIFISFNSISFSEVLNNKIKVGLLAPFSGEYKKLGESLLLSTQLALDEINDTRLIIIPRDSGSNNKEQLNLAIKEIIEKGAKVIIGPIDSSFPEELNKYKDVVFISLSNSNPRMSNNVINIGISLESQLTSLSNFITKKKKNKTVIMYPKNQYENFIDKKIKSMGLKNYKVFKYNPDPKILTGEIEELTNYAQRKRNLETRKKVLKQEEGNNSKKELEKLEQLYTLGGVDFDSVIIIDFGSNLKSVLTSLIFTDVDEEAVLFTTVNQWFDQSIFFENTVKNLYFPSVDLEQFEKYNKLYFKTFEIEPSEITILAYDALGLIYYIWNKNNGINSINNFFIKEDIKGKIGTFQFKNNKVSQKLKIYKTSGNQFKED